MDLPGVEQDRHHHQAGDHQPEELVLLDGADVEGEAEPAHAQCPAGEILLGGGQDEHDGGEAERLQQDPVRVEVGDEPTHDQARDTGDDGRQGRTGEELPGVAEGPVDAHVEHAEGVHAEAEEAHDAEVGDAGQPQLQV